MTTYVVDASVVAKWFFPDATQLVADCLRMPIETVSSHDLLGLAVEIALATGITVYDAMYLAMAINRGCQMLTADVKLVNLLAETTFVNLAQHVKTLQ